MSRQIRVLAVLPFLAFVLPFAASAQSTDPCAGLRGPALGLCRAAVNAGCDGSASQPAHCAILEDTYGDVSGEEPPWIPPPPCPCGDAATFVQLATTKEVRCEYLLVEGSSLDTYMVRLDRTDIVFGERNVAFSFFPGSYEAVQKQTCGLQNESLHNVTDAEAESCLVEITSAARLLGASCGDRPQ